MGLMRTTFEEGSDWVYYKTYDTYESAEKGMVQIVKRDKCEAKIIENKDTFTVAVRKTITNQEKVI